MTEPWEDWEWHYDEDNDWLTADEPDAEDGGGVIVLEFSERPDDYMIELMLSDAFKALVRAARAS